MTKRKNKRGRAARRPRVQKPVRVERVEDERVAFWAIPHRQPELVGDAMKSARELAIAGSVPRKQLDPSARLRTYHKRVHELQRQAKRVGEELSYRQAQKLYRGLKQVAPVTPQLVGALSPEDVGRLAARVKRSRVRTPRTVDIIGRREGQLVAHVEYVTIGEPSQRQTIRVDIRGRSEKEVQRELWARVRERQALVKARKGESPDQTILTSLSVESSEGEPESESEAPAVERAKRRAKRRRS